jgi:hypothetical protein
MNVLARNIILYWRLGKSAIVDITKMGNGIVCTKNGWEHIGCSIKDGAQPRKLKVGIYKKKYIKEDGNPLMAGKVTENDLNALVKTGLVHVVRELKAEKEIDIYLDSDVTYDSDKVNSIRRYVPEVPKSNTYIEILSKRFGEYYTGEMLDGLREIREGDLEFNRVGKLVSNMDDASKLLNFMEFLGEGYKTKELIDLRYELTSEIASDLLDLLESNYIRRISNL